VRLQITPELRHGQARQRVIGDEGVFRLEAGQAKETFDTLQVEFDLAVGQCAVLGACAEPARSLGREFFVDGAGNGLEKLVVLRIARAPSGDLAGR
jgi:hypothetical protein